MLNKNYVRKKRKTFFLTFFKWMVFICPVLPVRAQKLPKKTIDSLQSSSTSVIIPKGCFYLTLLSGITQKASLHKTEGFYNAKATVQPYWEAGADYQHTLKNCVSYLFGLHLAVGGRNSKFNLPVEKINPNLAKPYILENNEFDFGLALPLFLEKKWNMNYYKSIYAQGGIQLHYSFGYACDSYGEMVEDSNGNYVNVISEDLNANNSNKPWFTYTLGSGYKWVLKNNNLLKIGIVANLSFTHFIQGPYQINVPGDPITQGTYHVNGSYIAIAASYGFTGSNRRMVRNYEKRK